MTLTAMPAVLRCTALAMGLLAAGMAQAQQSAAPPVLIYTCIDANGKKLTSDRPIPECMTRDQRILNTDGSLKTVRPPTPTVDERAEIEARQREADAKRIADEIAKRSDRNLLALYPDEAAHRRSREAALEDVRKSVRVSEARMAALATERKPLLDEAEFYVGKPLPIKLRTQLDANDAAAEAQRTLIQNQQAEVVRINQSKDAELARLRKLLAGAKPGSMGALPAATAMASSGPSPNK